MYNYVVLFYRRSITGAEICDTIQWQFTADISALKTLKKVFNRTAVHECRVENGEIAAFAVSY